jgi:hypothetical protein
MNVTEVRIERRGGYEVGVDHPFCSLLRMASTIARGYSTR